MVYDCISFALGVSYRLEQGDHGYCRVATVIGTSLEIEPNIM